MTKEEKKKAKEEAKAKKKAEKLAAKQAKKAAKEAKKQGKTVPAQAETPAQQKAAEQAPVENKPVAKAEDKPAAPVSGESVSAAPEATLSRTAANASSLPQPEVACTIFAAWKKESSESRFCFSTRKICSASLTSALQPILSPRGAFMSVTAASVLLPALLPMETIRRASFSASRAVFMKAPSPYLTSRRMTSAKDASFLLMTEAAMSGMLSTVAVTSRTAYIRLSAGTVFSVCPETAPPNV